MKKKILVLGATGFIGRNMAEYFADQSDFEVYGTYLNSNPLDHLEIRMSRADLTNQHEVDSVVKGMDIIIQAAAITSGIKDVSENPHKIIADNAVMNSLIFRSAFDHAVSHVMFLSCTVMYHSSDVPLKEIDFDANREIYPNYFGVAWNKVYLEKMCEFYSRLGRNKYTAIRHSNIYGPYDKYDLEKSHVLGATITKVMTAKDGKIKVWGTGEEERDLLYVSDLVKFVELAIAKQKNPFELYNVGYGSSISVKDLVSKIIDCSDKQLSIEHDLSKPSIKTALCLDCEKAKEELGWEVQISLEEGIRKTIEWYKTTISLEGSC
jgi:nucleoside-diphosphate-sugar epimerase